MIARVLRPVIAFTTVAAVIAAALTVYAFLNVGSTHADSTFNPTLTVKLCNDLPGTFPLIPGGGGGSCVDNLTAGANADTTTAASWPSGDLNFSNVVTFTPSSFTIGTVATGTLVGGLHSTTNLGLLNGTCSTGLVVDFDLYSVAIPNAGTRAGMTNIAWPQAEGTSDRFEYWQTGSGVHTSNPPQTSDPEWATNADTIVTPDGSGVRAAGTTLSIQNYPSYLLDAFDPDFLPGVSDGGTQPIIPTAAYGGLTKVSGDWIPLYFVQFGAGALTPMPAPLGLLTSGQGQPNVSVLNDPTAVQASPSSISDFCTLLTTQAMLLGDPAGAGVRSTNPGAGTTALFQQYNASQRDTDQDGYENQIDTCPKNAAVGENPRTGTGDANGNGIGDSCDTSGSAALDVDGDIFQNRQDNCPLVANPTQVEAELGAGVPADKGPRSDGIGDDCDSGTVNITQNGHAVSITLATNVSNGRYMAKTNVVAKCIQGTDADSDGYCTGADGSGGDAVAARHNAWGAGLGSAAIDSDGDGFTDALETYMGTDPTKSCAQDVTQNNETPFDNWPLDFNDSGNINVLDVSSYSSQFNKNVGAGADARHDLNSDGKIDVLDVSKFSAAFNKTCAAASVPAFAQQ